MQIIVFQEGTEDMTVLEVPEDSDIFLLHQLIAAELQKDLRNFYLEFEGNPLLPMTELLLSMGVTDGAAVILKPNPRQIQSTPGLPHAPVAPAHAPVQAPAPAVSSSSVPPALATPATAATPAAASNASTGGRPITIYDIPADIKPEDLLELTKAHPNLLQQFLSNDPELGNCLATRDVAKVRTLMMKRFMNRHKETYVKDQELRALEADPMNPELQKKIEERIRLENIQQNMELALENLPEAFGRVVMLYVNIEVNHHPVKAFVDSGAQSTIMSMKCAERCGITRLIDTRFAGQARGVGTAKIIGRIHIAQMKFGASYFPISITVLENNDVDFLFGLDTLRRYRCCIDLDKNVLAIEGSNGREEISFLPESELPINARGTYEGEPGSPIGPSSDAATGKDSK